MGVAKMGIDEQGISPKCDARATDHMVRFTMPFGSFAYCKRSKTGAMEGLGTRPTVAALSCITNWSMLLATISMYKEFLHVNGNRNSQA